MSWQKNVMNEAAEKVALEKDEKQKYNDAAKILYSIMRTNYTIRKAVDKDITINLNVDNTIELIDKHNIDVSPFKVISKNSRLYLSLNESSLSTYRLDKTVETLDTEYIMAQNIRKTRNVIICITILACIAFLFYIFG